MVSDARAQQARQHHRESVRMADDAARHRRARDELVRALRREDPARWTYAALGKAVGCSSEMIAVIVKGDPRKRG